MLEKGTDFFKESVEKSWGKESANESGSKFISCFDSSFIEFVQPCFCFSNSEEFVNVFVRIGFGSTIKSVSFDESQVVTFNGKFICGFKNINCRTGSQSDNTVGSPHGFIIHWIIISKNIKEVTEVIDVENWQIDNSRVLRWIVSLIEGNSSVLWTKSLISITYNLEAKTYFFTLDYQRFEVNPDLLHDALQITPKDSDHPFVTPLPHDDIVSFINKLGYPEDLEQVSKMVINSMYQPWRTFMTMINKCLTKKASGFNRLSLDLLKVLWGMVTKTNVDYANLIWEDFKFQIDSRQISAKKKELLPFPRFTKLIIKHIVSLHNNLSERPQSYHHVIKLDAVLGNLKFANKGENDPIYGMAIPMEAISDKIKASTDYSNYLAKSKVDKPVKGKGKWLMLGRVRRESNEGTLDHSKKLKGVETISDVARYLIDMKTVTKESKNDYILQRRPKGQGEGFGVIS
ncbi:hypothetical protein Tco_0970998 [Tanacetum coccineum]